MNQFEGKAKILFNILQHFQHLQKSSPSLASFSSFPSYLFLSLCQLNILPFQSCSSSCCCIIVHQRSKKKSERKEENWKSCQSFAVKIDMNRAIYHLFIQLYIEVLNQFQSYMFYPKRRGRKAQKEKNEKKIIFYSHHHHLERQPSVVKNDHQWIQIWINQFDGFNLRLQKGYPKLKPFRFKQKQKQIIKLNQFGEAQNEINYFTKLKTLTLPNLLKQLKWQQTI